ncbi:NAD(P)-dependent dehydrogenase (short-subunit alcohol dehydrogenase family) [Paracoccus versutus]|uniref:NAD(P)-dependent dehydrogenase (Short-subunit alcohol dehydrogenase family) n=1 Tax=Paracoccus versutus TaxID=34007 RepID=A0AAQ0HCN4_PARVE|nr:coniferyl-alcohol dehydrogenase [Paracoccus versutus]REG27438.1 NAD(P)-dependent dehydrogenase (short-subunit alcohol dehydrogenase family) [Paracoccus versutus]
MMLFGKTVAITGVASGIGRRTAELATQMGADVIGIDRNPPAQETGAFLQGDLSSAQGVQALAQALPDGIDALLNIAGVSGNTGAAPTLAINFYGLRALSLALAPRMRPGGAIVSVASIAGYGWRGNLDRARALVGAQGFPDTARLAADLGVPDEAGYPVSKEALILWTQMAAFQPAFRDRGIRVNSVSPGPVETPILTQFREVLGEARVNSDVTRVGRAGTPGDIAPVVLFLASDGARWINGANIAADGGLEASINAETMGF